MTRVNVPLDDEENEIVELFMAISSKTKPEAIKQLIKESKELPHVKNMIEIKKGYNKQNAKRS